MKLSRRVLLLACLALALIPPVAAWAGTQITYAQGTNGVGGTYSTTGYAPRDYNQVWHTSGYFWQVYYTDTAGYAHGWYRSSANPTRWPGSISYGKAKCYNEDDNSFAQWTCQTTQ